MDRLQGKVIAVTGSTRGIGRVIAQTCAREGASVVLSGRNEADGEAAAAAIREAGGRAAFVRTDVTVTEDCAHLIDETVRLFGRIDGLVNNAGVFPDCSLEETDDALFRRVTDVDIKGAFFCIQQALRYMVPQNGGSIVNIGSTHWAMGAKGLAVYAISKGALHTLTQHVAHHYAEHRIRSNWVTVGWVLSDGEKAKHEVIHLSSDQLPGMLKRTIPFGRFQTEQDIANAALFLLSDESSEVTGTDIGVTGGFKPERNS